MKNLRLLLIPVLAAVLVNFAACRKQEKPKGIVTVVNEKEEPVWGAEVFLHAYDIPERPGDSIVVRQGSTDSEGRFNFEVDNPCVLTVEAWALEIFNDTINGGTFKDTIFGTASIRLEMDEVSEQKVILRP